MSHIELDDLVYTYPPQEIAGIQTLISGKEEFRVTASSTTEPVPKRGELFKHQEYLKRLMRAYDQQLIIWRTGTGKSCGVISVTEYYKSIVDSLEDIRNDVESPYKHAYVLVKGPGLIEEFKKQLVCKCTKGIYITDLVKRSKTERQRKGNITRAIKSFYTVTTYGDLAKQISKLNDQQMRHDFDHSIFIIDETHNLKTDPTAKYSIDPKTGNEIAMKTVEKGGVLQQVVIDQQLTYDQLHRVFHGVSPRKVMLLTATPMINSVSEIGPVLNLILPMDKQLPHNVDYNKITLEQFEPYLRGLVSYVRELDTGAIPKYQGAAMDITYDIQDKEVPSQMVVYETKMSEHQNRVYKIAKEDPEKLRPGSKKPEAFSDLLRQAANFVFPDGSVSSTGFKKYVRSLGGDRYMAEAELLQYISTPEGLKLLSCKFGDIVYLTKNRRGNTWCYSHFVVNAGAILLSLCFEAQGFERFAETTSVFSATGAGGLAPLCGSDTGRGIERRVNIDKRLRCALLTSDTPDPEISAMLELFNSYENRHGEYIKVIIGSPVTRDGLNLANVLQIHLVGPDWNQASSYQAESRAIRSTSHVDLIEEERERLRNEGKNPDNAFVEIDVYRHAAISDDIKTIDLEMYETSEKKDREIKRVIRMMKQVATDCQIHYGRNVRQNDTDYSATCDYDVCNYACYDPPPAFVDYSSYDVLYSGGIVEVIIDRIRKIFHIDFNMGFDKLYLLLKDYRRKFVDMAVTKIIEQKVPIIDRYGYTSYLREDRGYLFLRRDFPLETTEKVGGYSLSIYTETLIGIEHISLLDYINELQKVEQGDMLARLQNMDPNSVEFKQILDELNIENRVELVENAIVRTFIDRNDTPAIRAIIGKYQTLITEIPEPVPALQVSADALAKRGTGRGRKPKPGSVFKLKPDQEKAVLKALKRPGAETVYFHTLLEQKVGRTAYAVSAKFGKSEGKIRLLKPSEGVGWRDANQYELPVYNLVVKEQKEEIKNPYEIYDIYGTILEDKKFRIRDKTEEDVEKAAADTRSVRRGKVCATINKSILIDTLWKLRIMPFKSQVTETREQLIDYLEEAKIPVSELEEYTDEQLRFYFVWYRTGMSREQICGVLQKELEKMGRLLVV